MWIAGATVVRLCHEKTFPNVTPAVGTVYYSELIGVKHTENIGFTQGIVVTASVYGKQHSCCLVEVAIARYSPEPTLHLAIYIAKQIVFLLVTFANSGSDEGCGYQYERAQTRSSEGHLRSPFPR